jgi:peptidoglycan hydrolase-like protein with peptidoglycan-binding domain
VAVDGSFAAGTEQAVQGFQSATQLPADGIVGADTWFALVTD